MGFWNELGESVREGVEGLDPARRLEDPAVRGRMDAHAAALLAIDNERAPGGLIRRLIDAMKRAGARRAYLREIPGRELCLLAFHLEAEADEARQAAEADPAARERAASLGRAAKAVHAYLRPASDSD